MIIRKKSRTSVRLFCAKGSLWEGAFLLIYSDI